MRIRRFSCAFNVVLQPKSDQTLVDDNGWVNCNKQPRIVIFCCGNFSRSNFQQFLFQPHHKLNITLAMLRVAVLCVAWISSRVPDATGLGRTSTGHPRRI